MELEITPEPSAEERAAIAKALAALRAVEGADARSAWWREGLREALEGGLEPLDDRPVA